MTDRFYPWDSGRPTKPDVDQLVKTFNDLQAGQTIPYDDVAKVLGVPWRSSRFRVVTTAWRKRIQVDGFVLECIKADAFYVATAKQVAALTHGVIKHIGKKAKRQRQKLAVVPIPDEETRAVINHQGLLMKRIEEDSRKHRMNILPPSPVAEVPRINPPKSAS